MGKVFFDFRKNGEKEDLPLPEKYFAVVHSGQGRLTVNIEDTKEEMVQFLRSFCSSPTDLEAMGRCNRQGVIEMTNPEKFSRKWLNNAIRNKMFTIKDLFCREQ